MMMMKRGDDIIARYNDVVQYRRLDPRLQSRRPCRYLRDRRRAA